MDPVRIGCLGAARIAPAALFRPAAATGVAVVSAIAARDRSRAEAMAGKHGIARVHDSYEALVSDPELDAVYIPLPNALHGHWSIAALQAGKHVLCEKPFTANAEEAAAVASAASASGLVVMEAFHWRYHPLAARLLEIIGSGELGEVRRIEAALCFPLPKRTDIRWQLELGGGSLMDAGCYAVHIVRTLAGAEPTVAGTEVRLRAVEMDRWIRAELAFDDGRTARVTAGMWSGAVLRVGARVTGDRGSMRVLNPIAPHTFNLVTVKTGGRTRRERVRGDDTTYGFQLRAFAAAVRGNGDVLTPPSDSVANMAVIDAIYTDAGLHPRRPAPI